MAMPSRCSITTSATPASAVPDGVGLENLLEKPDLGKPGLGKPQMRKLGPGKRSKRKPVFGKPGLGKLAFGKLALGEPRPRPRDSLR